MKTAKKKNDKEFENERSCQKKAEKTHKYNVNHTHATPPKLSNTLNGLFECIVFPTKYYNINETVCRNKKEI